MLNEATIDKLNQMKLSGMAQGFESQIGNPQYHDLGFDERFGMIVDLEKQHRENRKLKTLLTKAKFRYPDSCVENIDFKMNRGMKKGDILSLSQNEWIRKKQNIIITGPTGVGKTYLACAFGNSACREGYSVLYLRMPRLLSDLAVSRADGSYLKVISRLARFNLIILDAWAQNALKDSESKDILEIIEDRYKTGSTILCTQIPIENWHESIGNPTIADAICDRLIHNAHHLKLRGGSMRKLKSDLT